MQLGINADGGERTQILLLQVGRRWLDDDLVLVIVLQAIGIFAVAAILGAARGLHVSCGPRLWPDGTQGGGGMKGAGAYFHVIGLQNHAAFGCPILVQGENQVLK